MKTILDDPLLTFARLGTILVQIALVIGQVFLGIAFAVTAAAALGWVSPDLTVDFARELGGTGTWFAAAAIFGALISLGLMTYFVVMVRQIIDTVGQGDPFVAENAARLTRMAWLALIAQGIGIAITLLEAAVRASRPADSFEIHSEASLTGVGLALVLFILARVFRQGAAMRDDLEGTV